MTYIKENKRKENMMKVTRLLRDYGQVSLTQAVNIGKIEDDIVENIFKALVNKQVAEGSNNRTDAIVLKSYKGITYDNTLGKAMDILSDIMKDNTVEFHVKNGGEDDDICIISFSMNEIVYDIIYISESRMTETLNRIKRKRIDATENDCHFIVMIDDVEQINSIHINGIEYFCNVNQEGEVNYYDRV